MTIEQQAEYAAGVWKHATGTPYREERVLVFIDGYLAAAEPREKENAELRARVAELEGEKIPPARELLQEEGTLSAEVESLSLDWCNEITRSAPVAYCGLRAGHDGAHRSEGLPELCYTPNECAGRTSCPRRPACSS